MFNPISHCRRHCCFALNWPLSVSCQGLVGGVGLNAHFILILCLVFFRTTKDWEIAFDGGDPFTVSVTSAFRIIQSASRVIGLLTAAHIFRTKTIRTFTYSNIGVAVWGLAGVLAFIAYSTSFSVVFLFALRGFRFIPMSSSSSNLRNVSWITK